MTCTGDAITQPLLSVIVSVYTPLASAVKSSLVAKPATLFFAHACVYGGVPPDGVRFTAPLLPPLHETG